jgi:hypothetical protein
MSSQAIIDFVYLWHAVSAIQLNEQPDKTIWRWTANGDYSAKSAYMMLYEGSTLFAGHSLVWKAWAPLKVKIFLWLALRRRHWAADRRRRHGLLAQPRCHLYGQMEEFIDHIIAACPFSREIWFLVLRAINLTLPAASTTTIRWWRRLRSMVTNDRRTGMDSLFALVSWQLWKERNTRCFRESPASIQEILQVFKTKADRWIEVGATGLRELARA